MKFYYVYKALAHPQYNHYINPFSIEERLMHVQEARRTLGTKLFLGVKNSLMFFALICKGLQLY